MKQRIVNVIASLITEDPDEITSRDSAGREIRIMTTPRLKRLQSGPRIGGQIPGTCATCRKPFVDGDRYVQAKRQLHHVECIEKINERDRNNRGPAIARDGGKARYKKGGIAGGIYSNKWSSRVNDPGEMNK